VIRAGADARPLLSTPRAGAGPAYLAGFQGDRRATGVHRPLEVRTLAVAEEEGRPFVLSVVDLIGLVREDTLTIRAVAADLRSDVVVAATHTHSGPDTIGLWGPDETTRGVDEGFREAVRGTVAAGIDAAVHALEPATVRAGVGEVDGVIRNTRDPEIVDRQVGVVAFDRPGGAPIATLVNVGVHPEVLDGSSTLVSPDLAGACRDDIDARRGGVTVWASGDLGGMQSPEEGPRTPDEVGRKGTVLADAALAALEGTASAPGRLRVATREVTLPLWNPRFRAGIGAGLLRGELGPDGDLVTEVAVVDLGVARAACWPGEVLPRLGLTSKARLDVAVPLLIGLANDELGYILPDEDFIAPEDWDDPDPHYEESMSVGPETGSRLLAAIDGLLDGWNDAPV
jgi:hypothetical protein